MEEYIIWIIVLVIIGLGCCTYKYIQMNRLREKVNYIMEMRGCGYECNSWPEECQLNEEELEIYKAVLEKTIKLTAERFVQNDTHGGRAFQQSKIFTQIGCKEFFYLRLVQVTDLFLNEDKTINIQGKQYPIYEYMGQDENDKASIYRYTKEGYVIQKINYASCYMIKDVTYSNNGMKKTNVLRYMPTLREKEYTWKVYRL